jgi:hypothetical protein
MFPTVTRRPIPNDSTIAAQAWFMRLFAVAVVGHIAGNPPFRLDALGISILALGVVAAAVILDPTSRPTRIAMAALVLVTVWFEAPRIGNHWVVAGFVALAILISEFRPDPWTWFAPTGRGILLAFYSFAAFAKLNHGFFDPVESCGLYYTNQSLASWGLPLVPGGGAAAVGLAAAATVIELAVPVLLVVKRTRVYGVMLGFVFHFLISLDLDQHFYDFTALLFALFTLFIDDAVTSRWNEALRRHRPTLLALAVASVILTVAAVTPNRYLAVWAVRSGTFFVWIPLGAALVLAVLRMPRVQQHTLAFRAAGVAGMALVALVTLNGLTPYLGLKTAYGFNMYANLHTVDGESNHWVVRRTAQLIDVPLVTIVESSDPGLAAYVGGGYLIPERNVLDRLADHPEATITYTILEGPTVTGTGAELGERLPVLVEKFGLFRSVDTQNPPRCQTVWMAAY